MKKKSNKKMMLSLNKINLRKTKRKLREWRKLMKKSSIILCSKLTFLHLLLVQEWQGSLLLLECLLLSMEFLHHLVCHLLLSQELQVHLLKLEFSHLLQVEFYLLLLLQWQHQLEHLFHPHLFQEYLNPLKCQMLHQHLQCLLVFQFLHLQVNLQLFQEEVFLLHHHFQPLQFIFQETQPTVEPQVLLKHPKELMYKRIKISNLLC